MASSIPTTTPSQFSLSLDAPAEPDPLYPDPVTEDDIEQLADQLLRDSVDALGRGNYPFYSKSWLRQLEARDRLHPVIDRRNDPGVHDPPALVTRLIRHTGMLPHPRRALQLTALGMKPHQIALRMGKSDTAVRSYITQAISHVARVAAGDGYLSRHDQIRDVRLQDQDRMPPDALCPAHCSQPCSTSGKCPSRWYLYV